MCTVYLKNWPVIAEIPPAVDWSIYLARLRVMLDSGNAFSSNVLLNITTCLFKFISEELQKDFIKAHFVKQLETR